MDIGELEPWQILLGLVVVLFGGIQTWWDFAEGRVQGPIGTFDRKTNPAGFWWIQIGRIVFVILAIVMIATSIFR
ncbi:hypothetical protein [Terricaulis silvestris]|uniref:Uncharacterized protein n=1 Tax=Terricaulis silvestris TaxID=2686094 RepID=A0A6I6MVM6_9CAUL|nr:hypothetical protein [Terricaulis silvestris]QGZ96817.1 hypothetical protein DSM104635_03679 [Terricaulis silvestris]